MKKKLIILSLISLIIIMMSTCVYAEPDSSATVIDVGSAEEYLQAFATIHESTGSSFVINLTEDIEVNNTSVFKETTSGKNTTTIDNKNTVTILGNGHTISLLQSTGDDIIVKDGTLNLGSSDGSNILTIKGAGSTTTPSSNSLLSVEAGTINMNAGVTLTKNYGGSTALCGGAVRIKTNGVFNMKGGFITDNQATSSGSQGGAIAADYAGAVFNMTGGEITNNIAGEWGGAIYGSDGAKINIKNGKISGNKGTYGGAIAILEGEINVENATLENNEASYGGALLNYLTSGMTLDSKISITNSIFKGNSAGYGGVILNWGTSCSVSESTFTENEGTAGGAIRNETGELTLENNTFTKNKANGSGGAIYSRVAIKSTNDDITENTASYAGGVYLAAGTADLSTTKVYNNKATNGGSDYYISANVSPVSIIDAASMNKTMQIDEETRSTAKWFKDAPDTTDDQTQEVTVNRFSLSHITDVVTPSDMTAENRPAYYLVASNDSTEVDVATVTFKVVNGTWDDGTTSDKTVKITSVNTSLKTTDIPTGMKANDGYKDGKWDKEIQTGTNITSDVVYTYTFEKETTNDETATVTGNDDVSGNSESNGSSDSTETVKANNPKTGDVITANVVTFTVSIACLIVLIYIRNNTNSRRNRRKNKYKII